MPAIRVKPSVKQGKTDAAVICESGTGPASRIIPVKSPDQQAPDCGTKSGIRWHVGANMQINAL